MKSALRPLFAACLLLSIAMPAVALADPGIMVHSTVTITMAGPVTIPTHTSTRDQCAPTQHPDVRALVTHSGHNQNCTFPSFKDEANTISFHMTCSGPPPIEADGHFTYKGDGNVNGTTHAEANLGGQKMTVDTIYAQTPTGATCNYTGPASAH